MDYFDGKKVKDIPSQIVGIDYCSVNTNAMKALGITKDQVKTKYDINEIQ